MKKILLGTLVGAILLFGWQALSWTALGVHDKALQYTPNQDALLKSINENLKTDGQYIIPFIPPGASHEEHENYIKNLEGKPWAIVTYHNVHHFDMVMPMVRGFLIAFVCVFLVCLTIQKFASKTFGSIFGTSLIFGLVSFLFVWYNGHNWFDTPWSVLTGELIDCIGSWSLCGIWLGYWYSKK